jgi:hypothetical protein
VNGNEVNSGTSTDGSFSTSNFKTVGEYSVSIAESGCDDSHYTRSLDKSVWVKYVRRELSTLTDADREAFLNAFSTLWTVNTVDGQTLYGDLYKDVYYFATIHNDAGGNSVCDEFHGDQGFVNNHMMLGAYLEQSLQLVDPSTCLHYMEYTSYFESDSFAARKKRFAKVAYSEYLPYDRCLSLDMNNQLDGGSWTELMTSKWFGSNDPYTGRIIDGRWEHASVPYMDADFFADHGVPQDTIFFPYEKSAWYANNDMVHIHSPYGLLRSPWNWNPNTFVSRFNNINMIANLSAIDEGFRGIYSGVSCADYSGFLEDEVHGNPLSKFLDGAEDSTHGNIHFTFGGSGGNFADTTVSCPADADIFLMTYVLRVILPCRTRN